MTSKISLFNKAIYKSTIRRNIWGSVLYFVMLFLITGMPLISDVIRDVYLNRVRTVPIIYKEQFLVFPVFFAIVVPTIVAMLLYRFVHSKKNAVFVHSLPISRNSNYISSLAAGFTLMALPVVANTVVLMILSVTAFAEGFSVVNCLVWAGVQILCLFVMFSVATFSAMITGNTFAVVVLNVILHTFAIILAGCFGVLCDKFLYGYSDNGFFNAVIDCNPVVWITDIAMELGYERNAVGNTIDVLMMRIPYFCAGAVALYVASWVLYKKRGLETAEDVAAFRLLNPVYKYFVTLVGALVTFTVFNAIFDNNEFMLYTVVFCLGAMVYFACEMILKKTFKVWYSYKGYICFAAVFAIMLCIFGMTSFFGYEDKVPSANDVDSVAVYNYYYREDEPYADNSELIDLAIEKHLDLVADERIADHNKDELNFDTFVHIKYKLKSGATMSRSYPVDMATNNAIMDEFYKYDEYVMNNESIFSADELMQVVLYSEGERIEIKDLAKAKEFINCVQSDVMNLDYSRIHIGQRHWEIGAELRYATPKGDSETAFVAQSAYTIGDVEVLPETAYMRFDNTQINANYVNTIAWLVNNGYEQLLKSGFDAPVYIADISNDEYDIYNMSATELIDSGCVSVVVNEPSKYDAAADFVSSMPIVSDDMTYNYLMWRRVPNSDSIDVITAMTDQDVQDFVNTVNK